MSAASAGTMFARIRFMTSLGSTWCGLLICAVTTMSSLAACSGEQGPCYPSVSTTTVEGEITQETTHQYSDSGVLQVTEVLSGAAERLRRETFGYDDRGNLTLVERDRNGDGDISETERFGYDDAGNQTSWRLSYGPDSDLVFAWEALYDSHGNMIQKDHLNEDGSVERRVTQEFDEIGRLKFRFSSSADDSVYAKATYYYDKALLIRIETDVQVAGEDDQLETFAHDEQDRVVAHCFTHPFDAVITVCIDTHFDDEAETETEQRDFDGDGATDFQEVRTYAGNLLVRRTVDDDADGINDFVESYEYDRRGNRVSEAVAGTGIDSLTESRYRCF